MRKEDTERKCECEKSVGGATWQNQENKKKSQKNQEKGTIARVSKNKIRYKNPRKRIVRKAEEKPAGQTEGRIQK